MVAKDRTAALRVKPLRQAPIRSPGGVRSGKHEIRMNAAENAAGCPYVDGVARAKAGGNVRMLMRPCRFAVRIPEGMPNLTNFQPAVNDVEVGRPGHVAVPAGSKTHFTEPSKKKENIARSHAVPFQMALGGVGLTEKWSPALGPREGI